VQPRRPSEWPQLFDIAIDIFDQTAKTVGREPEWTFGGGTALMLQIDHRESHDIDLFLTDPQFLPFLNPETQGFELSRLPDTYQTDGAGSLKLTFEDIGEIDFICCAEITEKTTSVSNLRGKAVNLETPAEIIAKKVYYRGASMQPRDMFDIAATSEAMGEQYVVDALKQCGEDRCQTTLRRVQMMDQKFASSIIGQLMYRDNNEHLITQAQAATERMLRLTLEDK
jgi:hypothetical protein